MESSQIIDREEEWIEKYRAANSPKKPQRFLKLVLGVGTLATLSLGYRHVSFQPSIEMRSQELMYQHLMAPYPRRAEH